MLLQRSLIGPILWIQFGPILFRNSEYFENSKYEISKVYCIKLKKKTDIYIIPLHVSCVLLLKMSTYI